MPTEVVMPQMGESITEGTLTKWLKKPGDTVARDEPLFEISTDKVDAEIPSPVAGVLSEIKLQEGTTATINTVVCTINDAGSSTTSTPAPQAAPAKEDTVTPAAAATAAKDVAEAKAATAPAGSQGTAPSASGPATEILMPQMGESITEGTITKWLKKVGDTVQRDEPIFEISTDKVDAEIPSPAEGVLTEIKVPEGSTVTINTVVALIGTSGSSAPPLPAAPLASGASSSTLSSRPEAQGAALERSAVPASASQTGPLRSSPLVRKIASENNIDLSGVLAPARPVASPSPTSWATSQTRALLPDLPRSSRAKPQQLPRRHLTQPPSPPTSKHLLRLRPPLRPRPQARLHLSLANSFPCPRCAPSLPGAWSNPSRPARMFTPSSRWT